MTVRWWVGRTRQFVRYVTGRVTRAERRGLAAWLTPNLIDLFDQMHRADQRHGLDVVAALRRAGNTDRDLLTAGLLHDCGKGRDLRVWHRIGWSLTDCYGGRIGALALRLPTFRTAFATLASHAEASADLALAAGCSALTADLIRHQSEPTDPELGVALLLADEAN